MQPSSTVESVVLLQDRPSSNLASSLGRQLPIHNVDIAWSPDPAIATSWTMPQCGRWRWMLARRLLDRID